MLVDEVLHAARYVAHRGVVRHVLHQQVLHPQPLVDDGWHDEHEGPREQGPHDDERGQDAHDAILHVASVLEELDHREEQVADEPCDEERQQHAAQPAQQPEHGDDDGSHADAAYEAVEGDLFAFHNYLLTKFLRQSYEIIMNYEL